MPPEAGYFLAFALVTGCVVSICLAAPRLSSRWSWGIVLGCAATLVALASLRIKADNVQLAALVWVAVMFGCSALGAKIGQAVEKPGHLCVVVILSAAVDTYSVLSPQGVTAAVVENETLLTVLALSWAFPGTAEVLPLLGMGDVTMSALYLGAALNHNLPRRRGMWGLLAGYAAVAVAVFMLERSLPALPFLGAGVLVVWPKARTLERHEWAIALLGTLGVIAGMYALSLR